MKNWVLKISAGTLWVIFILSNTVTKVAGISEKDALTLFAAANRNYSQGNYQDAISGYEQILQEGSESGAVYYNLGNSYFKAGQIGKAILNYERAKMLIPRDSDLKANEKFAKTVNNSQGEIFTNSMLKKLMIRHIEFYSADEMALILLGLFFVIGLVHLLSLYREWPGRIRVYSLTFLSVLAVIYLVGIVSKIQIADSSAVILSDTEAKYEPREEATTYFSAEEGSKVKVMENNSEWAKIKRPDGKLGWVNQQALEMVSQHRSEN